MSKYYVGQRLRMKALEQDQGNDLPNEFVVTFVSTNNEWVGLIQVKSPPGTMDTTRNTSDLDSLFEPIPETIQTEPLNRGLADPSQAMRVSKITVARLFNLGNYEHKRVEITVEDEPAWGGSEPPRPSTTLSLLEDIVEKLGPGVHAQQALVEAERNNVRIHEAGLSRDPDSDYDKEWIQIHKDRLAAAQTELAKLTAERDAALKRLDALGGYVTES